MCKTFTEIILIQLKTLEIDTNAFREVHVVDIDSEQMCAHFHSLLCEGKLKTAKRAHS